MISDGDIAMKTMPHHVGRAEVAAWPEDKFK